MLYAAYGSNLHPRRLGRRVPSARLIGCAKVIGWSLSFDKRGKDGSGKCSIRLSGDSFLYVAVYNMAPKEKASLDRVEGLGYGYNEHTLPVPGYGDCYTYIGTHLDEKLSPYDWYRDLVMAGCVFLGFPSRYTESIAEVPCVVDPHQTRAEKNRSLVAELNGQVPMQQR